MLSTLTVSKMSVNLPLRLAWSQLRSIATSPHLVPQQASSSTATSSTAATPDLAEASTSRSNARNHTQPESQSSTLSYRVARTEKNRALPVYTDFKSGGSREEIQIRRVSGDLDSLIRDLKADFPAMKSARINERTNSVIIKGLHPDPLTIKSWLEAKGL